MDATEYNERVWSDPMMAFALESIAEAQAELKTGKGWGDLALDNAIAHLTLAIDAINRLKALR